MGSFLPPERRKNKLMVSRFLGEIVANQFLSPLFSFIAKIDYPGKWQAEAAPTFQDKSKFGKGRRRWPMGLAWLGTRYMS